MPRGLCFLLDIILGFFWCIQLCCKWSSSQMRGTNCFYLFLRNLTIFNLITKQFRNNFIRLQKAGGKVIINILVLVLTVQVTILQLLNVIITVLDAHREMIRSLILFISWTPWLIFSLRSLKKQVPLICDQLHLYTKAECIIKNPKISAFEW